MLGRLFLLFTLVPLAEIYLLIAIGGWMGAVPTIALVAVTGMLGAYLARREGRRALAGYQQALAEGRMPKDGILSGLLIFAGGIMLITPGILTDLAGLSLMIPPVRRLVARRIEQRLQGRLTAGVEDGTIRVISFAGAGQRGPFAGAGDVIDVEAVDVDAGGHSAKRAGPSSRGALTADER